MVLISGVIKAQSRTLQNGIGLPDMQSCVKGLSRCVLGEYLDGTPVKTRLLVGQLGQSMSKHSD